jgi:prepilin-type processing-associated H-X9-DG protein
MSLDRRQGNLLLASQPLDRESEGMTPSESVVPPVELRLERERTALHIAWPDGTTSILTAARLREACRCAQCTAQRATGAQAPIDAALAIATIEPIGGYAVNIAFTDGHARGVFPWAFLRQLASEAAADGR